MKKMNISNTLRHFLNVLLLLLLLVGVNTNVWAWRGARIRVYSQPSDFGYVYANTSNSGSASNLTEDYAETSENKTGKTTYYFYLFNSPKSGYKFMGYSDNSSATSGTMNNKFGIECGTAWWGDYTEKKYYAIFAPISYKIAFNGNGSTSGSMSNMSMTYATAKALTANAFSRVYTVNYDANGGTSTSSSATVTYTFAGWEDRNSIAYNGTTYTYATFDAPYYANTYGDLYGAFGYNKYELIQHYVNHGKGESRSCKGATPGLYPNKATVNNLTTTADGTVTLYAHWNCANPSITLPAATKSGAVIEGWYNGETLVGLPGDTYTPTSSVTLTAHWIDKYEITITGSNHTLDVDEVLENAFTFTHAENPTVHISDESIFTYNANTITAKKVGTATIYFSQAPTSSMFEGNSDTWTITVKRVDNTLNVASTSYTKYVDQECTSVVSGKNSTATLQTSSSDASIAYYDTESNKIVIPNSEAKSFSSTDVNIRIWQEQTPKYDAVEKNIVVKVNKYTPVFKWDGDASEKTAFSYFYNTTKANIFSTSNKDFGYTIVSDNTATANVVDNTLYVYNVEEIAHIKVTQEENYKWNGKETEYLIEPVDQVNHVTFTYNVGMYNDGTITTNKVGAQGTAWTADGVRLGGSSTGITSGEAYNWDDKYVIIKFEGIPDKLSFKYKVNNSNASNMDQDVKKIRQADWYVEQSADGSNWSTIWSNLGGSNSNSESFVTVSNVQLLPSTRYLKLCYSSNFAGFYNNVVVTELNDFSATPALVDFGTKGVNFGTQKEKVTFSHANAGRITTMKIVGDDAAYFSIERSSIPGTGRDLYGTATIDVDFDNKKGPEGHEPSYSAVLHIEDNAGHSLNIPLQGVRDGKTEPEFSFNANHLPYFVGTNIANVASSSNTDYANCPLTFETSDASIAEVIDGTLHIYNKKEEVIITISQDENIDFSAGSATFRFTPRERPERTVPMQLVKSIYNEGTVEAGNKCTWVDSEDGIRVGNTNTAIDDWIWEHAEKNFTIAFDGQPGRLSFDYSSAGGIWAVTENPFVSSPAPMWEIQESSDGSSWHTVWFAHDPQKQWTSVKEVTLSPSTRYLRFSFSGNYWGYFRNINISELVGYKYLRAESDGRYLSRGAIWGTQAIVDDFGMACRISNYTNDNTNFYTRFLFVDNQQYLYEADNHEIYTDDGTANNTYNLWKQNVVDGTILTFQSGNEYPGNSRKGQYITLVGDALALTTDAASATRWQMEDYTEHEAYITAMMNREAAAAAAKDFGSSVNTLEKVRSAIAENEFDTTVIAIPALALGEQKGVYRYPLEECEKGTYPVHDGVISNLEPGFYRLTVKAFYRISSADIAWTCHAAGMESVLAYIYANDVEYPIQSLYKSYQVSSLEPSDELRGGHYYSNDLTSAGKAFGDEKRYLNDVYVYVPADAGETTGTLRYGIKNPSYVPGAWLAYKDITLTRFARKEYIFEGNVASDKENWEVGGNWNKESVPNEHHAVIIRSDVVIEDEVKAYSLAIENDAKVVVAPNGGLTVGAGGVKGATVDNFKLAAGTEDVTKGKTGFLRISPEYKGTMPQASVELYTIGYYNMELEDHDNIGSWQYIGTPVVTDALAKTMFTNSWIYSWDETTGGWVNNRRRLVMEPFTGYATSQDANETGIKITYKGNLFEIDKETKTKVVNLSYTSSSAEPGCNVLANSFTAPIDITKFVLSDFSEGVDPTINLFNTGSKNNIAERVGKDVNLDMAGQYISIPIATASALVEKNGYPSVIPSMQGFYVNTTKNGTIKLDYERLIWKADYSKHGNVKLRAPRREREEQDAITGAMNIILTTEGWNDQVCLLESPEYTAEFVQGYDARKMVSGNMNIFTVAGEDKLAVDATNSIIGTRVGVRTGSETAYTFVFSHLLSENGLALYDAETEQTIDIDENTEYTFFAAPETEITDRFQIVARADAPAITTGVDGVENEAKAVKFIKDDQIYILKNGVLYNAMGAIVR